MKHYLIQGNNNMPKEMPKEVRDTYKCTIEYHEKELSDLLQSKKRFTQQLITMLICITEYITLVIVGYYTGIVFLFLFLTAGALIPIALYIVIGKYLYYSERMKDIKNNIKESELYSAELYLQRNKQYIGLIYE